MRRLLGSFAAAVLVSLLILLAAAGPARADEESIRHLDATFAIQADGTVDVRYEIQWHFAETGHRGSGRLGRSGPDVELRRAH